MEANIMKSRSDLGRKTQWTKHPPPPSHHLEAKAFSSRRLSSSSSVSLSSYLNPSDIHDDDDDDEGQQLYSHGGTTVSIPFNWESQPGTPKVQFRDDDAVPPLTPPPSYFCNPARDTNNSKLRRKAKFLTSILPKLRSPSPPLPTSSSSSSSSLWSSVQPSPAASGRAGTSTSKLPLPTRAGKRGEEGFEDHVPAMSFGFGRRGTNARPRGCYLAIIRVLRGNFS